MKKIIATISTGIGRMAICFNGDNEPMTAELGEVIDEIGFTPDSIKDAIKGADDMYGRTDAIGIWDIEWNDDLDPDLFD